MKIIEKKRTEDRHELYLFGLRIRSKETWRGKWRRNQSRELNSWFDTAQKLRAYMAAEEDLHAIPQAKRDMPDNTVWQLWYQGEENAPGIVKKCLASVRKHTAGRPYVLLTADNILEYLDIPDFIIRKYKEGKIGHANFSDIVRLMLLAAYGGTWLDATILLTAPIPEEVEQSSFFAFRTTDFALLTHIPQSIETLYHLFPERNPWTPVGNPFHCCSSWFLHASRQNTLVCKTLASLFNHWKDRDEAIDYFIFHYFVTLFIIEDVESRRQYTAMPHIANYCPHVLQFSLLRPFNGQAFEEIKRMSFAHKLTYKFNGQLPAEDTFYNELLSD